MSGIIIDIGTGDGKFVYKLAKENPDRLFIGIDPHQKGLEKLSSKIYKKEAKGGLQNAFFVLANIEDLPEELENTANQVFINFPWGSLLQDIVLVNQKAWENIKMICKDRAIIDIVFGYEDELEEKEIERLNLPKLDIDYVQNHMLPKLESFGFKEEDLKELGLDDLKNYPSSWAKKLSFGSKNRDYYYLRLIVNK